MNTLIKTQSQGILKQREPSILSRFIKAWKERNIGAWAMFFFLVYIVIIIKISAITNLFGVSGNFLLIGYSVLVSFYILSRFILAYFYTPKPMYFEDEYGVYEPTVSFAVPSKNEEDNIYETIMKMAQSEYPKEKLDIIAVNDGSTDRTLEEMYRAQTDARQLGVEVQVIDWKVNQGKREGMAECVRQSTKEIIFFVDSDSFVNPDAVAKIVKYFSHPKIAAVAGQAYVANADVNMLTKMQSVKYYVAFKAYKAAEALFGTVTCCSGCCSAYRRSSIVPFLEAWSHQMFLGVRCTYGDDRSLTNYTIYYGYDAVFAPEVISYTFVPETTKQYLRQQLRWKKSWVRESILASLFMWRKNIIMSTSFYLGFILPLLAPFVVLRVLMWYPLTTHHFPTNYFFGIALMGLIYGLYYYIHTKDKKWIYGVFFATFYSLLLIWQLPYAILNLRDTRWGTR